MKANLADIFILEYFQYPIIFSSVKKYNDLILFLFYVSLYFYLDVLNVFFSEVY